MKTYFYNPLVFFIVLYIAIPPMLSGAQSNPIQGNIKDRYRLILEIRDEKGGIIDEEFKIAAFNRAVELELILAEAESKGLMWIQGINNKLGLEKKRALLKKIRKHDEEYGTNIIDGIRKEFGKKAELTKTQGLELIEKKAREHGISTELKDLELKGLKDYLISDAMEESYVTKRVNLSDELLRSFYDEHIENYFTNKKLLVNHILVSKKDEAEEIENILQNEPNRFTELVASKSIDRKSASRDGMIDQLFICGRENRGFLEYFNGLENKLDEGEISGVIKSPYGFHIFKVVRIIPENWVSFEETKKSIRGRVIDKYFQEHKDELVEQLKKKFNVNLTLEDMYK